MASTLNGLFKTLSWSDFPERKGSPPAPGKSATAAQTSAPFSRSGVSVQPVAGSRPAQFKIEDKLVVTASFSRSGSFVMEWVFKQTKTFQDDMLSHEQGHYNITALICRDFFVDVMLLKAQTFSTAQAGLTAFQQAARRTLDKIDAVQKLYDKEVHPEQDSGKSRGPIQQGWDAIIQSAFTQARSPATQSPNGVAHKVRLVDVMLQKGKRV
jgi:hypothetical protein